MLQLSGNWYNIQKPRQDSNLSQIYSDLIILYEKDRKTAIGSSSRSFKVLQPESTLCVLEQTHFVLHL